MEGLASAFSGLPYFNPMMTINRSETCATRRLSQCWGFGIYENDVTPKFQRDPSYATDLSRADFFGRKAVIEDVEKWCDEMEGKEERIYQNRWTPILYMYEIVKSSAKRERDWGHLVFTDMTLTRFLLVLVLPATCNCGNFSHHDYDALTRYHTDRFMSLLTYLHSEWKCGDNKPNWVRATYTTPESNYKLNPDFLSKFHNPSSVPSTSKPSIYHVASTNFLPTLLSSELEKIDNVIAQGGHKTRAEPSTRDLVLGTKEGRPNLSSKAFKGKTSRVCAFCETVSENKDLQKCSKCKLVFYCGRECQRMAWPSHKLFCKTA